MPDATIATTDRLVLRPWREEDRAPYAALNADPEAMRHFPKPLTRAESDALVDRFEAAIERHGFSFWATELRATGELIGSVGIHVPQFEAGFMPAVEIGWRLDPAHWGRGYATEAANAALAHGFEVVGLDEIVSFTAVLNEPSQAVMQRLGMVHDPAGDFDHPLLPADHRLARHVLYRLPRDRWRELRPQAQAAAAVPPRA